MSTLKASFTKRGSGDVIEVPLNTSKPLTDSIIQLRDQINAYLTKVLEQEIKSKETPVSTVEQDERDEELKEMKAEEEEEGTEFDMTVAKKEGSVERDSPMAVDRPDVDDKQNVKKLKTDP
jgi:hypothetical protein